MKKGLFGSGMAKLAGWGLGHMDLWGQSIPVGAAKDMFALKHMTGNHMNGSDFP